MHHIHEENTRCIKCRFAYALLGVVPLVWQVVAQIIVRAARKREVGILAKSLGDDAKLIAARYQHAATRMEVRRERTHWAWPPYLQPIMYAGLKVDFEDVEHLPLDNAARLREHLMPAS